MSEHPGGGTHRFFLFETKSVFEPVTDIGDIVGLDTKDLYHRVDYAVLSCACGYAIKRRVIEAADED